MEQHLDSAANIRGISMLSSDINDISEEDLTRIEKTLTETVDDFDKVDIVAEAKQKLSLLSKQIGINTDDNFEKLSEPKLDTQYKNVRFDLNNTSDDDEQRYEQRNEQRYEQRNEQRYEPKHELNYDTRDIRGNRDLYPQVKSKDEVMNKLTDDEQKRTVIDRVFADIDHGNADMYRDFDRMQKEEDKSLMLEHIEQLRTLMEQEGVSLRNVRNVTESDPYDIVLQVFRTLRIKESRLRYSTLAEEFIMIGIEGLGWVFDGKREILGKRIKLDGFQTRAQTKLRRMRYDTAQIVGDVFNGYNIGPKARLALELLPSMFLYATEMSKVENEESLYEQRARVVTPSDDAVKNAVTSMHNIYEDS